MICAQSAALLCLVIGIQLVLSHQLWPGLVRNIDQARPPPRAYTVDFLCHESIGFPKQLYRAVWTRARPGNPALWWSKKVDLGVWNPIGKLRRIDNHETVPQIGEIGASAVDRKAERVKRASKRSHRRSPASDL